MDTLLIYFDAVGNTSLRGMRPLTPSINGQYPPIDWGTMRPQQVNYRHEWLMMLTDPFGLGKLDFQPLKLTRDMGSHILVTSDHNKSRGGSRWEVRRFNVISRCSMELAVSIDYTTCIGHCVCG